MQKPTPSYAITAPTHYPDAAYAGTHHMNHTNASQINSALDIQSIDTQTERDIQSIASTASTTTGEPNDSAEIESESGADVLRVPYKYLVRVNPKEFHSTSRATAAPTTTPQTTETPTSHGTTTSDESVGVHYGFDIGSFDGLDDAISNSDDNGHSSTETSVKYSASKPSNGNKPQAPHYHNDNADTADESTFVRSTSTITYNRIQPTSTIKSNHPEQSNQFMTKYVTGDAKTLTVTTTKTTVVRSHTITLTKTKTSTLVDTITHTLVKPTRVSYEPTIKPTIYTAPVTLKKVLGSTSSMIVPNPSFSIYANIGTDGE